MKRSKSRLAADIQLTGTGTVVVLTGQLDEHGELARAVQGLRGSVTLDCEGIDFINSLGLREWVRALRELRANGVAIRLRRCSEAIVMQLNMIREARAPAESFYAPYVCRGCRRRSAHCVDIEPHRELLQRGEVPELVCSVCGDAMVLDEIPERYLAFLAESR